MTISEKNLEIDEYCYLILAVFGGYKSIRNDRRCINNIMMITTKVFEFELQESLNPKSRIGYTMDSILNNEVESAYARLHRLVFHCQYQNMAFIEEIFELIVKRLRNNAKNYSDGDEFNQGEKKSVNYFDYESVIRQSDKCNLRAENLRKFLIDIIDNIIMKNINKHKIMSKLSDCK